MAKVLGSYNLQADQTHDENRDYMVRLGLTELCFHDMHKASAFLEDVSENIHFAPQRYRHGQKVE